MMLKPWEPLLDRLHDEWRIEAIIGQVHPAL